MSDNGFVVECLINTIGLLPAQFVRRDETWHFFNYKSTPIVKNIWMLLRPKKYELIRFIDEVIFIMAFIDIINSIKKTGLSINDQSLLLIGAMDGLQETIKLHCTLYTLDLFMKSLVPIYLQVLSYEKEESLKPFIGRAYKALSKANFEIFTVGIISLWKSRCIPCGCFVFDHDAIIERLHVIQSQHSLKSVEYLKKQETYSHFHQLVLENILKV